MSRCINTTLLRFHVSLKKQRTKGRSQADAFGGPAKPNHLNLCIIYWIYRTSAGRCVGYGRDVLYMDAT